ncbi:MAG TPA: hypothetical protein VI248_19820, partial [Kineosporiaceae bacterium]
MPLGALPGPLGAGAVAALVGGLVPGLLGGGGLTVAVRVAVAVAGARLRAGDWPLRRLLAETASLALHDAALGLAGYALVVVLPAALVPAARSPVPVAIGTLVALALTDRLLRRRRGLPLAAL